jgi:hypothetical protein
VAAAAEFLWIIAVHKDNGSMHIALLCEINRAEGSQIASPDSSSRRLPAG